MQTTTAECPTCKTSLRVEYEGHYTAVKTEDCAGCGADLCDACEQFTCTGCDRAFCVDHLIQYDGEEACAECVLWWVQDEIQGFARKKAGKPNAWDIHRERRRAWRRGQAGRRVS